MSKAFRDHIKSHSRGDTKTTKGLTSSCVFQLKQQNTEEEQHDISMGEREMINTNRDISQQQQQNCTTDHKDPCPCALSKDNFLP
jgi:hypothetical protein